MRSSNKGLIGHGLDKIYKVNRAVDIQRLLNLFEYMDNTRCYWLIVILLTNQDLEIGKLELRSYN